MRIGRYTVSKISLNSTNTLLYELRDLRSVPRYYSRIAVIEYQIVCPPPSSALRVREWFWAARTGGENFAANIVALDTPFEIEYIVFAG